MALLLKKGRVIDPSRQLDEITDLLIADGRIVALGDEAAAKAGSDAEVLSVSGMVVCPGLVDLHTHLREPGFEHKETIATGAKAGAAGGFTTLCCMPNTQPAIDTRAVVEFVLQRGGEAGMGAVLPIGALTKGMKGEELAELGELVESGAVALSDDGFPIQNAELMRRAMEYAAMFGVPVIVHCEDKSLTDGASMNEGLTSTLLGLRGMPAAAEESMVSRNLMLAEMTGCPLHIAHVSTAGSVELIRRAKAKGIQVTAEVCPQHLAATDEACLSYDTAAKVNPPLRTQGDVDALIAGLCDGTIDCIATDHAPHAREEKEVEFDKAPFGISILDIALPLAITALVPGKLSLPELIDRMSTIPAKIVGLPAGTLQPGAVADVLVFDPATVRKVEVAKFESQGKNCPFDAAPLTGWPVMTIASGRVIFRELG